MKRSTDRILTTHAGSLPRPAELLNLNKELVEALAAGRQTDVTERARRLGTAVRDVVARQRELGIDIVNDGEFGKATRSSTDYGAWQSYAYERLTGWEPGAASPIEQRPDASGLPVPGAVSQRKERREREFADFYAELSQTMGLSLTLAITGPIAYTGQALAERDITNLQAGLTASGVEEGFMTAVAPGSFARGMNRYYSNYRDYLFAVAEAMSHEYRAIVEAGLVLQIDDPGLAESWDAMDESVSIDGYRRYVQVSIDALNHALDGLPEDRIRYHLCWGSWHGPHTTDLPLEHVIDLLPDIHVGGYSFEAGNVRHEHEWKLWRDLKLPEGKILLPGVVSHATNVVEHPRLVADRIMMFASIVGREHVIASTDCGLGGRLHPSLVWAKLRALVDGAELASQQLW